MVMESSMWLAAAGIGAALALLLIRLWRRERRSDAVRTLLAWARVLTRRDAPGDRRRAAAFGREAQRRAEELNSQLLLADALSFNSTVANAGYCPK